MSNNFNIHFGVGGNYYPQTEKKEEKSNNEQQAALEQNQKTQLPNNDVLDYMAAQNMDLIPQNTVKSVEVSKYVTPEEEARIAAEFGAKLDEAEHVSTAAQSEFPDLSNEAADAIAASIVFNA